MPINPADPGQSATLFLEESAKFLREAQENGDTFTWTQTDEFEEPTDPDSRVCKRRLMLEITCRERPENSCCQPVAFTSEGGIA